MPVVITNIQPGSPADRLGIRPGARLLRINGHEIHDVLDYGFYAAATHLAVEIEHADGRTETFDVFKTTHDELGLESDSFLMDSQHRCRNNCVFCFIDQLPAGLRESLYFKDDDERLSFLFGNYITLTNLTDHEIDRIIEMKISPVNISVHTTDPALRCAMMGSRFAGEKLAYLRRLAAADTAINCQIVLVPGMNDGAALEHTLADLCGLYPAVRSVACVPVGLTAHRAGLPVLEPFDGAGAGAVLDTIDACNARMQREHSVNLAYASDEFYLLAGHAIPPVDYYGELYQIENGVGMLAVLADEFDGALALEEPDDTPRRCRIATGEAAYGAMCGLVERAKRVLTGLDCIVTSIRNDFFGGNVSVAGLVTATDIIAQLGGFDDTGRLLIPCDMLRAEGDLFLDSISVDALSQKLGREVRVVNDGADLLDALCGR